MTPKVQKIWQVLEQQRVNFFDELARVDPSVLNRKPVPEVWSAYQNLEHLLKAETASYAYLQKKLSSGDADIPKAGFKSWLRRLLLRAAFAVPTLKFKAPVFLGDLPETSDFDDLNRRFASQRATLKIFLDTLPNTVLEGEVWKHARAGKLSVAQMLDFFQDHFDRHEKQIKKAIK